MSVFFRSMAFVSWTITKNASPTSVLSLRVCSAAEVTIRKWACWSVGSDLRMLSLTAASKEHHLIWWREKPNKEVSNPLSFIFRDSKIPKPPPGTKWKEVRYDNKVTWLVSWTENIQGSIKYIMLNPSSRIKVNQHMDMRMFRLVMVCHVTNNIELSHIGREGLAEVRDSPSVEEVCGTDPRTVQGGLEVERDEDQAKGCCSLLHRQGLYRSDRYLKHP